MISHDSKNKDVAEKRMNICRGCEYFKPKTTQCKKCGCFMRFKTVFMKAKCPIGKWAAE